MSDHVTETIANDKLNPPSLPQPASVFRPGSSKQRMLREASLIEPTIRNPFVYKVKLSLLDKIKIGTNAVLLMPIRLICVGITLIIASIIARVITIGYSDKDLQEKPFTGWRKKFRGLFRFVGRAIAFFLGFHKIEKIGKRASIEEASVFIAAPHTTYFDALVFFVLGLPIGVSRSENAKLPIIGNLVRVVQPILVTREDSKNKLRTIEEIKKRTEPASKWPQLLVFPEGTTTNGTCLISFKPGAFIPGKPVQPVIVEYPNRLKTTIWTWEGLSAYKVAFFTICQFNNRLRVTYLPVYTPSEEEKNDPRLFSHNVRKKMANHLKVQTTNHTYEDCRLMLKARELNLPFESGLIEFDKIKQKLNINYDNCQEILQKFTTYARKSDGKMSLKDFSDYLELPPSPAVVSVFNMYDRGKDGFIDFREFLIGLSLLSQPANTEDTLKLAFNMFDKSGKGHISLVDLQSILYSAFSMPPEKVEEMFKKIDTKNDGVISYDELKAYAAEKPEYARIFLEYNEIKILRNNLEINRIASPRNSSSSALRSKNTLPNTCLEEDESDDDIWNTDTSYLETSRTGLANEASAKPAASNVIKRPMSDRNRPVHPDASSADEPKSKEPTSNLIQVEESKKKF